MGLKFRKHGSVECLGVYVSMCVRVWGYGLRFGLVWFRVWSRWFGGLSRRIITAGLYTVLSETPVQPHNCSYSSYILTQPVAQIQHSNQSYSKLSDTLILVLKIRLLFNVKLDWVIKLENIKVVWRVLKQ